MNRENADHDASIVPTATLNLTEVPAGVDRRAFMMRSAVVGAAAVIAGCAPPSPQEKIRDGFLSAAAIGYLCKHNATLSGAEGGCQAEIGVASAMGAAFIAQAHDFSPQVVANAAEASLQHHLGMTCDPVAGFVQLPCIERCAFGAVKAWTGFVIATNEIPAHRRVDFDTTVAAMALTAKEMNVKYKETSKGGLAVSVVLC
jgi:L-serine dehydratase